MKKNILLWLLILFSTTQLFAEKVKIFDLEKQILETSGNKVEKFKVDDLLVSTNLVLSPNKDSYISKNGYFSITFNEPQNNFLIYLNIDGIYDHKTSTTWKLIDKYGESIYIYHNQSKHYFEINNKQYEYRSGANFKIVAKNGKFTLFANNVETFTVNFSNLEEGIKTIEFNGVTWIGKYVIYK